MIVGPKRKKRATSKTKLMAERVDAVIAIRKRLYSYVQRGFVCVDDQICEDRGTKEYKGEDGEEESEAS